MKRKLIECPYCPCHFFAQKDFERHMKAFGDDPAEHLLRFMKGKNLSSKRRRELRIKYLEGVEG